MKYLYQSYVYRGYLLLANNIITVNIRSNRIQSTFASVNMCFNRVYEIKLGRNLNKRKLNAYKQKYTPA